MSSLVNDQDTLKRIVGGLRPSDMSSVSDSSKIESAINILTAASSSKALSSVQVNYFNYLKEIIFIQTKTNSNKIKRSSVYNLITEGAAFLNKTTTSSPDLFFKAINQTIFEKSAELFVEAP